MDEYEQPSPGISDVIPFPAVTLWRTDVGGSDSEVVAYDVTGELRLAVAFGRQGEWGVTARFDETALAAIDVERRRTGAMPEKRDEWLPRGSRILWCTECDLEAAYLIAGPERDGGDMELRCLRVFMLGSTAHASVDVTTTLSSVRRAAREAALQADLPVVGPR